MENKKIELKGFTLVELIVVITIITILSTIGFISYTGYLEGARDTKRFSDIGTLNNSIKNLSIKGFNLSVLTDSTEIDRTGNGGFYDSGKNLSGVSGYKAGLINYNYLIDLSTELVDPVSQKSYIIGVYNNTYELAATLEESKTSYILRNNKLRTSSGTTANLTGTIDTINKSITLLNREDNVKYRIGDFIGTGSTSSVDIVDIVGEKIYLSDITGFSNTDIIRLYKDDTSLIGNIANGDGSGTDCIVTTNVGENKCPIEKLNRGLLPYKIK